MLRINDMVDGMRVAPAAPITALVPISMPGLVERAVATDAAPNTAAPIISSRRRPIRSPSVPIGISRPASTKA